MKLPLYKNSSHDVNDLIPTEDKNFGLIFERFFNHYHEDRKPNGSDWAIITNDKVDSKGDFLKTFNGKACGSSHDIQRYAENQYNLVESLGGLSLEFELSSHFVTGTGNAHPVENGMLWHPTLGVPYLTGSQVKGMLRTVVEQYFDGSSEDRDALLIDWFGSKLKDSKNSKSMFYSQEKQAELSSQAGRFIFFDAIPVDSVQLGVDIMTPHMGGWYAADFFQKDSPISHETLPADWHSPIPIKFLVIKKARFLVSIAPRSAGQNLSTAIQEASLQQLIATLQYALSLSGAGAKTQNGYGQMREVSNGFISKLSEKNQELRISQEISRLTPTQQQLTKVRELLNTITSRQAVGSEKYQKMIDLIKALSEIPSDTYTPDDKIMAQKLLTLKNLESYFNLNKNQYRDKIKPHIESLLA